MNNHGAGFVMSTYKPHFTYPIHRYPPPPREHHHTVNVTYTTSMSLTHQRANL